MIASKIDYIFWIIIVLLTKRKIFLIIYFSWLFYTCRLEAVDIKNPRGLAKIFGTIISLAGALTMSLYKGHAIQSLQGAPFHVTGKLVHYNWIKGSILAVASCISWSVWYIMQVHHVENWWSFSPVNCTYMRFTKNTHTHTKKRD